MQRIICQSVSGYRILWENTKVFFLAIKNTTCWTSKFDLFAVNEKNNINSGGFTTVVQ